MPGPFDTPDEQRAQAYRLQERARLAAEFTRARLLRGDPAHWTDFINRWWPMLYRQPNDRRDEPMTDSQE